jgi:hypothetical protein
MVFPYFILTMASFFWGGGEQVLGLELRALHLEPLHQPFFVVVDFERGSRKLFAILLISAT